MNDSKIIRIITIAVVSAAALFISLPGAFSTGPIWPDGQRYVFNGILIHDMVRDMAIFDPYGYNVKFYDQYPATNLPYGPPFFALVFAAAFGLFGISFPVARCIVSFYTVCAALMCWYAVYSIKRDYWLSIIAVSALLFFPLTVTYSRDITPELPIVFFSFLTLYFSYNYLENNKKYHGAAAAISFSLGYLTKPYIIPLGAGLILYFIVRKKWGVLYKTETWLGILVVILLTVPYTLLSFKYSTEDLGMSPPFPPVHWEMIYGYPWTIVRLSPVVAFLSLCGFVIEWVRRDKLVLLLSLWVVLWYLFFSFYLGIVGVDKYLVTIIPALALPFAIGFREAISRIKINYLKYSVIICVIGFMIWGAVRLPIYYVKGYEEAGEFVAKQGFSKSILFYGSYDGAFMMGIRKNTHDSKAYVLRGDRKLAVRLWWGELKSKGSVKSPKDAIKLLQEYKTQYVVFEWDMARAKNYEEYAMLKDLLQQKEIFKEVRRFPIENNYRHLVGSELVIYEVLLDDLSAKSETLAIPVPTLKKDLQIPF